ncbi:MAG: efflux RND transporter periplasmic adaptor subunit [Thermodesulfobacteriota bacterium]
MNDPQIAKQEEVARLLGAAGASGFLGKYGLRLAVAGLIALGTIAWALLREGGKAQAPRYRTEEVTRGPLVVTVSATGNLQPTNQVDVGCEISGTVESVLVEDNERVKKGQLLARLDTSRLEDQVVRSRAALAGAEAQALQMEATAVESRATLARLRQVAELSGGKVPSKAEIDTAEANVKRAEANEANARASIGQARAALSSDETNLSKATIRSPIEGVVLKRNVEPGQTVAASLQAPVLFTLAENLSQMELRVDVDEADVGQVRDGQSATFGVDAYPGRRYQARIARVHYGSQTKENVVSYVAVLTVANPDLSLRPGMTATAEITTAKRENALQVANAALRFTPAATSRPAKKSGTGLVASLVPRPPASTTNKRLNGSAGNGDASHVYVLKDGVPVDVPVTAGVTDGRTTEVTCGSLREGDPAITESLEGQP